MNAEGEIKILVPEGSRQIKYDIVRKNVENYDAMMILSHFKGYPMGGFGGTLKNMSIGIASKVGKVYIHAAGDDNLDPGYVINHFPPQTAFNEAAYAVQIIIIKKNGLVYINVMNYLSVDYDCLGNQEKPCMVDIGVLGSLEPDGLDRACVDLIYKSDDPGRDTLIERIESRYGLHILEHAVGLGLGYTYYNFINIDEKDEDVEKMKKVMGEIF